MCLNAFGALREQHLVFLGLVCSTYQPLVAFPCVEQALSGSTYLLHPRAGGFARFFYPAPEQGPALGQGTFLEQDRSILPQKRDLPWGRGRCGFAVDSLWVRCGFAVGPWDRSIYPRFAWIDEHCPRKGTCPGAETFFWGRIDG